MPDLVLRTFPDRRPAKTTIAGTSPATTISIRLQD